MRLERIQPGDEELRVLLEAGFVMRDAGRLDDAEAVFRGVAELAPGSEVPRVALGTVQLRRGQAAEAHASCEDGLRLRPGSHFARVHLAEALLCQGQLAEAEDELAAVIAADPDSPHSRTARALLDIAPKLQ